jgi:hypothetical protein
MARWRVEYEEAFVAWIERQRPSLIQICAAVRWVAVCKSSGPPKDGIPTPDPDRPEDKLSAIPMANIDVLYLAYEATTEDSVLLIRDFTSY